MSEFDPYYKWLGIPPKDQPPNHYRLLGIELFEDDVQVIESAVDRQMAHVRTFQTGAFSAVSQKLLNELASAKLVLLQPRKKVVYDAELRAKAAPPAPQSPAPQSAIFQSPAPPAPAPSVMPEPMRPAAFVPPAGPLPVAMPQQPPTAWTPGYAVRGPAPLPPAPMAPSPPAMLPVNEAESRRPDLFERRRQHRQRTLIATLAVAVSGLVLALVVRLALFSPGEPEESQVAVAPAVDPANVTEKPGGGNAPVSQEPASENPAAQSQPMPPAMPPAVVANMPAEPANIEPPEPTAGIDLLKDLQLPGRFMVGAWRLADGVLVTPREGTGSPNPIHPGPRLELIAVPPDEYTLVITARRIAGTGPLVLGLVKQGQPFALVLDQERHIRFSTSERSAIGSNLSWGFPESRPGELRIVVKDDVLEVWERDNKIWNRNGPMKVGMWRDWYCADLNSLWISSFDASFAISKLAIIPHKTLGVASDQLPPQPPPGAQPLENQPPANPPQPVVRRGPSPVPPAAAVAEAVKAVRKQHPGIEAVKRPADKAKQAAILVEEADASADLPQRYALFQEAHRLLLDAGDTASALVLIDNLAKAFDIDRFEWRKKTLTDVQALTPEQRMAIAQVALDEARSAIRVERFDQASAMEAIAMSNAQKGRNPQQLQSAKILELYLRDAEKYWNEARDAQRVLADNPDDPPANVKQGRYLCFILEKWDDGLPLLAKGSDVSLASAAKLELREPALATDQAKLGEVWATLADRAPNAAKMAMRTRAIGWYQKAIEGLDPVARQSATLRLQALNNANGLALAANLPRPDVAREANMGVDQLGQVDRAAAMWVFQLAGSVDIEAGGQTMRRVKSAAALPATAFHLTGLDVSGCQRPLGDELGILSSVFTLQRIAFVDSQVTDNGLAQLKNLPQLTTLELTNTGITDAGVPYLTAIRGLQSLKLNRNRITDEGAASLEKLKELVTLELAGTSITDKGLESVGRLTKLHGLFLNSTRITDQGVAQLTSLGELEILDLSDTHVSSTSLEGLSRLPKLMLLDLSRTSVSDLGLEKLARVPLLQQLILTGTGLTDAAVPHLAELKNLNYVSLQDARLTAAGVQQLKRALPKCVVSVK